MHTMPKVGSYQKYLSEKLLVQKCAQNRSINDCLKKTRTDNVKCVLYGSNRSVKDKAYTLYKQLQQQKYPTLTLKNHNKYNRCCSHPSELITLYDIIQLILEQLTTYNNKNLMTFKN